MKKRPLLAVAVVLLIVFASGAITLARDKNHQFKLQKIQLENRDSQLKLEEIESTKLNNRLNDGKAKSDQEIQQLKQEVEQRKQNEERLQRELQARLQQKQRIATAQTNLVYRATGAQTASAASFGGNKQSWLAASGIPESDWWAVDSIVSRESGWNPNAVNKSSGACGLGQQLPCGKWAGAWNDPVAALRAQHGYVNARYGGYPQAVAFWNRMHWY